MLMFTL